MTTNNNQSAALKEIYKTLNLCDFCTRQIGLTFKATYKRFFLRNLWTTVLLLFSGLILFLKVAGEIKYVFDKLATSSSVVDFVSGLHIAGYDTMSFGKLLTLWYKKKTFEHLLIELVNIWPIADSDKEAADIKGKKLSRLRMGQFWYTFWNILGVWLYNLTPIAIYMYHKIQGVPAYLDYIWHLSYPFDKTKPVYHEIVFVFELYAGVVSVWCMLGSDILFMTMSSHISMLLQLLQLKIRRLNYNLETSEIAMKSNSYQDIVSVVKIHQKLINFVSERMKNEKALKFVYPKKLPKMKICRLEFSIQLGIGIYFILSSLNIKFRCEIFCYGNDLEDAFSMVNLINVLLSSVNICCVVFNILLEPWMAMSNKFFLGAALTQVGILCWYADDIYTASAGVADAVYESSWYNSDTFCRRALLVLIQRSQRPLYFTAMKFSPITMKTYSSILTSSYSYFALLYTVYRGD